MSINQTYATFSQKLVNAERTNNVTRHRVPKLRAGVACAAHFLQILLIFAYVAPLLTVITTHYYAATIIFHS